MSRFWGGVRKVAVTGAARATVAAETAVRRVEVQHKLAAAETECLRLYAAIGRSVVAAARNGAAPPAGVSLNLAAVDAAEAEVARLRAALAAGDPHQG